ncbi:MAG: hypothetical protein ACXW6J_13515 [Candidatus Binatia bacterium]
MTDKKSIGIDGTCQPTILQKGVKSGCRKTRRSVNVGAGSKESEEYVYSNRSLCGDLTVAERVNMPHGSASRQ